MNKCFFNRIFGFAMILCGGTSLLALNSFAQDLVKAPSVFVFKRLAGGAGQVNKTVYREKSHLPTRKAHENPKPANSSQGTAKPPIKPGVVPFPPPQTAVDSEQLGITMWRLRPEKTGDSGARLLTMGGSSNSSKMIAERVGLDTIFKKGEKVRISVESPQSGYLYIIDRELRKDKSVGDPYMIFPTLMARGGDNYVSSGKVVEIPAQTDNPCYFEIGSTDVNYAGELLSIIVSPVKIGGLKLTMEPLQLTTAQVEKWETEWERMATTFELETSRGLTYTEEEKAAGEGTRQLTQKSPPPQTGIKIESEKGKPFLVSFPMKVGN